MKSSLGKRLLSNNLLLVLYGLLFAYFSSIVLFEIPQTPFYYDSGIHIDAAKMLAYGLGKPITPYTYELFSTQTTGPTLTWFGAIFIRIFGAHIWTAGFAAATLSLLLLAVLCWRLYRLCGRQCLPITLCLFFVFLLQNLQWWTIFIGDISSLLLFLIATTLATDPAIPEKKRHIYVAIAATLSLRARLTSLPMIAGLAGYLLLRQAFLIREKQSSVKTCISLFTLSLAVFLGISVCFEGVEYSFFLLSPDAPYSHFLSDRMGFLSGNSTLGIATLLKSPDMLKQVADNMSTNYALLAKTLQDKLGIPFILPLILASMLLSGICSIRQQLNLDRIITVILLAFLLIAFWFFFLARMVFDRYTMQLVFLIFALLLLSSYSLFSWKGIIVLTLLITIAMPASTRIKLQNTLFFIEKTDDSTQKGITYNQDLQDAVDYLVSHPADKPLAKCGWMSSVWSFDYLLPPGEHFSDCYTLIRSALVFDDNFYLQNNPEAATQVKNEHTTSAERHFLKSDRLSPARYIWRSPVNFILVIDKNSWRFSKFNKNVRPIQKALQDACKPTTLFDNDSIRIMDCQFENLQKNIHTNEFSFFVDETPYWKR